ncbi:ArsR/SmtB family transcription factor [Roseinatronobacter sp.]|uniref:ArsR/SmtB family transcription factor n=1 Tax=Roseinatronobacter sp. TaxID=1945755 RepID=UPI003F72A125
MDENQLDHVFKALADPTRRRIIDVLREQPDQSLFQICAISVAEYGKSISRQAMTQHLDMLQRAGLVAVTWSGRTKIHALNLTPLQQAVDIWLRRHL